MLSPFKCTYILVYVDIAGFISDVGLVITVSFDWIVSQKQHVCYYAKTEYIAFAVVRFLILSTVLYDLWCHVAHRPTSFVALGGDPIIKEKG